MVQESPVSAGRTTFTALPCLPGYRVMYSDLTPHMVSCLCCVERMRFFGRPTEGRVVCLLRL